MAVEAHFQVNAVGRLERDHGELEQHAVRQHHAIGSGDEGCVEEPEGGHGALHGSGHATAGEAHALTDPERTGALEHDAGK